MRRYFIAGNWKMNKTVAEALELVEGLKKEVSGVAHRVMVAPPFTALDAVAKSLKGSEYHPFIGLKKGPKEPSEEPQKLRGCAQKRCVESALRGSEEIKDNPENRKGRCGEEGL